MGTQKKTVVTSWYMVTSQFRNRAKDCCVITDTVVKKMAISAFGGLGTEPNTEQCDITDQLLTENDNIYIWEQKPKFC